MDLRKHREDKGQSVTELAENILKQMGVKPAARGYDRKLRNMVEYVRRWEDKACRPSPKYMPHVIAASSREVAISFYE